MLWPLVACDCIRLCLAHQQTVLLLLIAKLLRHKLRGDCPVFVHPCKCLGTKVQCTLGWPYTEVTWLYCDYFIWCVSCNVVVLTCVVICSVCMCGLCNVWVWVCVGVCLCGLCNVWVWVCVCVGFVMIGFCNMWVCVCVGVLVICVLVFTVFLYCFIYVCLFFVCFC
jgi:hypothetical protein